MEEGVRMVIVIHCSSFLSFQPVVGAPLPDVIQPFLAAIPLLEITKCMFPFMGMA